jgi:arsenite oxidase small subunit
MPHPDRRDLLRQAACVAGAWAASGALPAVAAGPSQKHARSLLVNAFGDPFTAGLLKPGEPHLFNYPFVSSPAFLLALEQEAPVGVGARKAIVAFSAICSHKMMYPTPAISFIGVRKGQAGEPAQVIHCCGDNSRYDATQGARVISGPAPQPLAAVLLEWEAKTDRLWAVGTQGGDMFKAFFDKYAFKLEMEHGSRAQAASGATAVVKPAREYSRQWQSCAA